MLKYVVFARSLRLALSIYGKELSAKQIERKDKVHTPYCGKPLVELLTENFPEIRVLRSLALRYDC